jgi:glutaredoxin 3
MSPLIESVHRTIVKSASSAVLNSKIHDFPYNVLSNSLFSIIARLLNLDHRKNTNPMNKVIMYSTARCPFCVMAEKLLNSKGVTDIEKLRVDLSPDLRSEMMERTNRRTVPQIYIGDIHVGGFDDLAVLDRQGKLDVLLADRPSAD